MIKIRPFKGYRPKIGLEDKIACKPYDVIDYNEALAIGKGNPFSFVHVIRPEINLPYNTDPYSKDVYNKAKETLQDLIDKGHLVEEEKNVFYIYRQIMNGRVQNGIVGCISIDDYGEGRIKKHEHTRIDKEQDRINHFYYSEAHTEPVFLFHKKNQAIKEIIKDWTTSYDPIYDFSSEDGVRQMLWVVDEEEIINYIQELFASMDSLYIADGHHRTASSYKVGMKKRQENLNFNGDEEFNHFMSVIFSDDELFIMPYNRAVKHLNGYTEEEFLAEIGEKFIVMQSEKSFVPNKQEFTMILGDKYYSIIPKEGIFDENNIVDSLDVSILQNNILSPILDIKDPRTDDRIEFFGGEGMIDKITERLNNDLKVAFLLHSTQIEEITAVSDAGKVMPPKSTWFEPKLLSGLFVHKF